MGRHLQHIIGQMVRCGNCKAEGHARSSHRCPLYLSESEIERRNNRANSRNRRQHTAAPESPAPTQMTNVSVSPDQKWPQHPVEHTGPILLPGWTPGNADHPACSAVPEPSAGPRIKTETQQPALTLVQQQMVGVLQNMGFGKLEAERVAIQNHDMDSAILILVTEVWSFCHYLIPNCY